MFVKKGKRKKWLISIAAFRDLENKMLSLILLITPIFDITIPVTM